MLEESIFSKYKPRDNALIDYGFCLLKNNNQNAITIPQNSSEQIKSVI